MKIAINTRFLLKDKLEGIGWFTFETIRRLVEAHPEHEFHFFFDRKFSDTFIFAKNVTPHVLFPPARHPFLWYMWFEISVNARLKKIKPDIFLSTDGFLSLSTDIPQVLVIHDLAFEHFSNHVDGLTTRYYKHFVPRYAHKANHIAAVSGFTKNDIVNRYKINPSKIDVTYNGCNECYRPLTPEQIMEVRQKITGGAPFFIFAGAIHPRKNVARLFLAFDKFKTEYNSGYKLVIAGRKAWDTDEAMQIHSQMKHKADVIFMGHMGLDELSRLMGSATALCYVSLFEGFGIPILEAMNCGVPVITSDISSMPEVAGHAALLVNPYSVEEIKISLMKMATDDSLRSDLIARGFIQKQNFSWDKTAAQLYNCMLSCLNPNP